MERVEVKPNWHKTLLFGVKIMCLFILASVVANAFPPVRDVIWFTLGLVATRLDLAAATKPRTLVKHVKRGTTYNVLGKARIQTEWPVVDNVELTVYQGQDGIMWARPTDEFEDGRFVKVDK